MFCTSCGKEINENNKFCKNCGAINKRYKENSQINPQTNLSEPSDNRMIMPKSPMQQQYAQTSSPVVTEVGNKEAASKVSKILAVICIVLAILIVGIVISIICYESFSGGSDNKDSKNTERNYDDDNDEDDEEDDEVVKATRKPKATSTPKPDATAEPTETPVPEEEQYILPDSDSKYLEMSDLEGMDAEDCRKARNEIYARHGRKFKDETLQQYFESCDWYEGTIEPEDFREDMLNDFESANRDLIIKYETEKGYR